MRDLVVLENQKDLERDIVDSGDIHDYKVLGVYNLVDKVYYFEEIRIHLVFLLGWSVVMLNLLSPYQILKFIKSIKGGDRSTYHNISNDVFLFSIRECLVLISSALSTSTTIANTLSTHIALFYAADSA